MASTKRNNKYPQKWLDELEVWEFNNLQGQFIQSEVARLSWLAACEYMHKGWNEEMVEMAYKIKHESCIEQEKLEAANKILRDALEFIAVSDELLDCTDKAREAIEENNAR